MFYGLLWAIQLASADLEAPWALQIVQGIAIPSFEASILGKYKVSYRLGHANGMGYQGRWIHGGTLILNGDHTARIVTGKRVDPYLWTLNGSSVHLYGNQDVPGDPGFAVKSGLRTTLIGEWHGFTFRFQQLPPPSDGKTVRITYCEGASRENPAQFRQLVGGDACDKGVNASSAVSLDFNGNVIGSGRVTRTVKRTRLKPKKRS